jgi:hypothetical protein
MSSPHIGGACTSAIKSGTLLLKKGESKQAISCKTGGDGCMSVLTCTLSASGALAAHHSCDASASGPAVTSGCSTMVYQGKPDPHLGSCCFPDPRLGVYSPMIYDTNIT